MRENCVKKKLAAGERVYGTLVGDLRSLSIPQMMASAGFDFIMYDTEHSGFSTETISELIIACRAAGIVSLIRIPSNKYEHHFSRPLDMGAQGLVVPNILNTIEVKNVMSRTKYFPEGQRGMALSRIHSDFSGKSASEIIKEANDNLLIMIQIESKEAIEQIEEILSVPGIDSVLIGPGDLSQSLGIPGQIEHELEIEYIKRTLKACQKKGVPCGISVGNINWARRWLKEGMNFLLYMSDIKMVMKSAREAITDLRNI